MTPELSSPDAAELETVVRILQRRSAAVEELHARLTGGYCEECSDPDNLRRHPCPTLLALRGDRDV